VSFGSSGRASWSLAAPRAAALALFLATACLEAPAGPPRAVPSAQASSSAPRIASRPPRDAELAACRARLATVRAEPALPGASSFEAHRAEVFGRARGTPVVFVRAPARTPDSALPPEARSLRRALARRSAWARIGAFKARFARDPATLRALILREGYLYSSDPSEALALVSKLRVRDLFDAPSVALERGNRVLELERDATGRYRYPNGRAAELLLGDRVAPEAAGLGTPLHRDLRPLAHMLGFDRARIERITAGALVADLRFGTRWVRALLPSRGAALELGCLDAPRSVGDAVAAFRAENASRKKALASIRAAVGEEVAERLPFDRPRGEMTEDEDGMMRGAWRWAYLAGQSTYEYDDESYAVFDAGGRAHPPEVCVRFVLDCFERAAGRWFRPRGATPGETRGALDFRELGLKNEGGVVAFGRFAENHPEFFDTLRLPASERIPFARRRRFFEFLVSHADLFRPGDVVAIQGKKDDGKIHQHALLLEDTDPVTGFPDALADQMYVPRRRTWEAIMAAAPLRAILYRVRLRPNLLARLDHARGAEASPSETADPAR
jgi:hypothetical protein